MSSIDAQVWKVTQPGAPEGMEWETVPVPDPGPGEVRLRQTFAGVNFVDVYQRSGLYTLNGPIVLGVEGTGTVEAVGDGVTNVLPGDRVGYGGLQGGYATARLAPAGRLIPLPEDLSDAEVAAVLFKGMTAELMLRRVHKVEAGEVLLVEAAAGGLGQLVSQWATALGATVIGVVSTEAKAQLAREAGCAHVIVSQTQDVGERVRALTGGRGVDVAYESTGGDAFTRIFDAVRPFGKVVSYGQASGKFPSVGLDVLGRNAHTLSRPSIMKFYAVATPQELAQSAAAVFEQVRRRVVRPHIGQRWPLSQAPEAHRALEGRRTVGSTLLEVK